MMDRFSLKTEIVFGNGAVCVLEHLKGERVMLVADPYIVTSGIIKLVSDHLNGCEVEIFSEVVPDPPMETIAAGIVAMNRFEPTVLIACGGGSAIDSAKGIYFYGGKKPNVCGIKRFIVIPTTSGTGSEVTKFAVITDKATGQKYPLVNEALIPDMAVLDVDFVKSVPAKITADTGLDVLTHAIEAYVSKAANTMTDALAEKAVKLVFEYLVRSYHSGEDLEAREKMHEASLLAGIAFNEASLGLNHAIAHNLGGRLHIPHGRINAILLCPVIWFNADITGFSQEKYSETAQKYAKLAKICGVSTASVRGQVRGLMEKIHRLMKALDMPVSLKEAGISENEIKKIESDAAKGALLDACMQTNPRNADEKQILGIIRRSWSDLRV